MHQPTHTPLDFYLDEAGLRTVSDAVAPFLDTEALCNWLRDSAEFTEAVDRGWLDRIAYRLQIKGDISAARPDELLALAIIDEVPEVRLLALDALRARFLGREAA